MSYVSGGTDEAAAKRADERFWDKFDKTNWGKTKIAVAYMIEDDYDGKAYKMLTSHLKTEGVQLYGKGFHGRHNDATKAIAGWFKSQYAKIINEDFSRRIDIK